jgi:hypothetical protein
MPFEDVSQRVAARVAVGFGVRRSPDAEPVANEDDNTARMRHFGVGTVARMS